ncbi:MAG: efflux RND transporter permease subunit [Rikenellaceae bacterium]
MGNFFIRRPIFAISLAITFVMLGVISIANLSIEQYPDITPPVVQVTAIYDGADAQTVNNTVATPIGQSIMGVSNLLYMQTTSGNDGSMNLQATFDIGTNADMATILTLNNLSSATSTLPEAVIEQGVNTQKTMPNFLMVYSLHSDGRYDESFLTNYAYINLQNELLKINGVSKVDIMGAGEYAMRIWVDPLMMSYYNITLQQIEEAINIQAGVYPTGKLGAEPQKRATTFTYTLTLPPQFSTPEEFSKIILRMGEDGQIIRLGDLATINLGSQSYDVVSTFDDLPSAMIMIYQTPQSNALEVGAKIEALIAELSQRMPDGLTCTPIVNTTTSVKAGITDIFRTLIIALGLVILIIYLFLQNIRATIIPLIAIPVSLIGAFILFPWLGFTINIISLLGLVLAIGLVVDDAIVVVEAVQVNISKGMSSQKAATQAMKSVSSPIIATTIVLLAVFIPVSFIPGVSGLLFQQFAAIISLSVVISAINALTLSPALASIMLKKEKPTRNRFFRALDRQGQKLMQSYTQKTQILFAHLARTSIFLAVVIVLIALLWSKIPKGFLPEEDQGYLMVMVETPESSALETTNKTLKMVDEIVSMLPEVELTSYAAGYNMLASVAATNAGIIFVKLKDYSQRKLSTAQIAMQLNQELYVGVSSAQCYAFIPPAIPGLGLSSGVTLQVQDLEGKGGNYLYQNTLHLMQCLEKNKLIEKVTTQYNQGIPQREIKINTDHALSLGIDLDELYTMLGTMFGGTYINNFNRFGQLYQTYIQAAPEFRRDKSSFGSFYINNSQGEPIPISSFIEIKDTTTVEYISQYNLYRSIGLTVDPAANASTTQVMNAIEQIANDSLPLDIGFQWSGVSYQQSQESKNGNLIYALIIAFVFVVLAALYNSWSLPLSILMALPLAILGALLFIGIAHLIDPQYVNDTYMQISLFMLIALSAKNAILVVEYADRKFFEEKQSLKESAIEAAKLRVRPILMTAFAFILGVMPLVFASGVYATARSVIGVALVGGMVVATLVGIFLYPTLYYLIGKISKLEHKREKLESQQ